MLFKQNKVNYIKRTASFMSLTMISVQLNNLKVVSPLLKGRPSSSPLVPMLHHTQVAPLKSMKNRTSTLLLQKGPEKIVIIGSGIIRLETGSIWICLGSKVVVVKFLNSIRGAGINKEISYVHSIFQLFMR